MPAVIDLGGGNVDVLVEEAHVALAAPPPSPRVLQQVVKDQDPLLPRVPEVLVQVDGSLVPDRLVKPVETFLLSHYLLASKHKWTYCIKAN